MPRVVLFVVLQLAAATAALAAGRFEQPPLDPPAPFANQAVSARIFDPAVCSAGPIAVEQVGTVINLRYVPDNCPILPPGLHLTVPLGRLQAGTYDLRLYDVSDAGNPQLVDEAAVTVAPPPCVPSPPPPLFAPDPLCLQGGRYAVRIWWSAYDGSTGFAHPVPFSDETGAFWFFGASNYEVMVKMLDACSVQNRFWFYAAGLTDVGVNIDVEDTVLGFHRQFINPLGTPFPPIADVQTFPCVCEVCTP